MGLNANKLIFKRLVREYEFLLEDLEDIEAANSEIKNKFMESLSEIDEDKILQTEEIDSMASEWVKSNKESEEFEKEVNKHPDFKNLFRKVVVKCHPDKLSPDIDQSKLDKYIKIYEDSVDANETEDWAKLIRCAIKLELEIPESAYEHILIRCAIKLELEIPESAYEHITSIEKSIDKLKEKQNSILNSTAWQWYKTTDSASKTDILKQHLEFMAILTKKK